MAVDTLSSFPSRWIAGDTLRVSFSGGSYPASSWTGKLAIVGPDTDKRADWSASGDDHAFVFSAGSTSSWAPGEYSWTFLVTENATGERKRIDGSTFYVSRDPAAEVPYMSFNERMLKALKDFQAGRLSEDAAETFSIDGQSFTQTSVREITRQIAIYEARVKLERDRERRHSTGLKNRNVRFTLTPRR